MKCYYIAMPKWEVYKKCAELFISALFYTIFKIQNLTEKAYNA